MVKIEALTLQEAYEKASCELDCSITDLNFEVIQHPSSGFLGLWRKSAIIVATCKPSYQTKEKRDFKEPKKHKSFIKETRVQPTVKAEASTPIAVDSQAEERVEHQDIFDNFYMTKETKEVKKPQETKEKPKPSNQATSITEEVEQQIRAMFKLTCFEINDVRVSMYDSQTMLIEFDGKDAALLIGKDGYRYKAISYMLFNWINPKYGLMIRLEIAQFLKNQEEMIENYLHTIADKIEKQPKAQTKQLDGILLHIALTKLRERYPNKYIAIKNQGDKRFVVINDFIKEY